MDLVLSAEEQELLVQILEQRHLELQKEICTPTTANSKRCCARMKS